MTKTRITAIISVKKKIILDLDYSLDGNNQRQMDTVQDELETKFHLAPDVLSKEIDIIEILQIPIITEDSQ